jgi:cell division protein FtsL
MAKRRVGGRRAGRRSLIAVVLVGFVAVTTGVIARRVRGVNEQRRILELQRKREALDAERTKLESAIRDASGRSRLQPIAEQRLNMHIAKPEQQIILSRSPANGGGTRRPPHDSL